MLRTDVSVKRTSQIGFSHYPEKKLTINQHYRTPSVRVCKLVNFFSVFVGRVGLAGFSDERIETACSVSGKVKTSEEGGFLGAILGKCPLHRKPHV